jgi:hypothetical protein
LQLVQQIGFAGADGDVVTASDANAWMNGEWLAWTSRHWCSMNGASLAGATQKYNPLLCVSGVTT